MSIKKQDTKKYLLDNDPILEDEQSASGSSPDPEVVNEEDTLERAQDMGLYGNADEEHPKELDIAGQINNAEEDLEEE